MAHAEELFPVLAEPVLYEFIDAEPPASIAELRHRLARSESRRSPDGTEHWLNWVVRDAAGRAAGYVQATVFDNLDVNVAYAIGSAFWGKGIATDAVTQMLELVTDVYGVRRFAVVAERANCRSVRLAQRLGFVEVSGDQAGNRTVAANEILMYKVVP